MSAPAPDEDAVWSDGQRRRVERLCARLTGSSDAAQELAQETLLEAWRHRDRLVDPRGASAWIDAIARNVCHRWRVRQARQAAGVRRLAGHAEGAQDPIGDFLDQAELEALLQSALGRLAPQARELLVSRYVEELGPAAIADRLQITPDAVSMRLQRARARLREVLETDLAGEPAVGTWRERYGLGWRRTRLVCGECGKRATYLRRDAVEALLELRCDHCDPQEPSAVFRLDNPGLAAVLADVTRPSALVGRTADWSHRYWSTALVSGGAVCTRCGRGVPVQPFHRPGRAHWRAAHGWHTTCAGCGEGQSTSVAGLVLNHPSVRRLRQAHPGARIVGDWGFHGEGRDLRVVGVRDASSSLGLDVLLDASLQVGPDALPEVQPAR